MKIFRNSTAGVRQILVPLSIPLAGMLYHSDRALAEYTYTTPIPPGIAAPAQIETQFGTLNFGDGVPDQSTTTAIFDNLDFQRAVQAYLLALPVVNQMTNRKNILSLGPANITVPIWEDLVDSRTIELTANNNTPYTWFWIDLKDGPIVIEVPPKVLGLVDDIWYNWVGDLGLTGADGGEGGKYLFLPPGYDGNIPDGYFVIRPGSYSAWAGWRSFLVDGDPRPGVDLVKTHTKIYRLSAADQPPALNFINMSGTPFNMVASKDFEFWELLNQAVQNEPTDTVDATKLGFWASVGIVKGKPFSPDERMKTILTKAAEVGDATARALFYRMRDKAGFYYGDRNWKRAFIGGYKFETEPGVPNLDAAALFFFAATGVTPAMDTQEVGKGSAYAWTATDSEEKSFDGGSTYQLHLPGNIPVKDFWSVIVYDTQTRSMLQTDNRFPSLSSQRDVEVNADGSVDIYFAPTRPAGKANWIQTIPGKSWFTILRLYGPLEPWFNLSWKPENIRKLK